jgi:intracellular sulfur oxidation DsrE/DsrF family protein
MCPATASWSPVSRRHPQTHGVRMKTLPILLLTALLLPATPAVAEARYVETPYQEQKVVFDFYFDDPRKIDSALFWIRALINPLMDEPYGYAPEFLDLIVVIHGTEIVTTVEHNYEKYKTAVERMKYYASLGVKFKVCGLAAGDYGYSAQDFHDFVELIPSAITELAHWQQQGYASIKPDVMVKKFSIEEIR